MAQETILDESKFEVADAGEMAPQEADDLTELLATWIARDNERRAKTQASMSVRY